MPIAEDDGAKGAVADLLDGREGASAGLRGVSEYKQRRKGGGRTGVGISVADAVGGEGDGGDGLCDEGGTVWVVGGEGAGG